MDEFSLYITVPGRKGRKATEKKLADVMQKTKSASLNVTWIMEGRQDEVINALQAYGFQIIGHTCEDDWHCFIARLQ